MEIDQQGADDRAQTRPVDRAACPACGGPLIEIRAKLQCSVCHAICETCCEGAPQSTWIEPRAKSLIRVQEPL